MSLEMGGNGGSYAQRAKSDDLSLISIVSLLPEHSYSNEQIAAALQLRALPKVCQRLGIRARRTFLPLDLASGEVIGDSDTFEVGIAAQVGEKALAAAGISRDSIKALCFVSCTAQRGSRTHFSLSCLELLARLALPETVHTFEMDVGCDGFVRALHVIRDLFRLSAGEHVLVIATSIASQYFGRQRCARLPREAQFPNYVFGDAATAAVIGAASGPAAMMRATWSEVDPSTQLGWTHIADGSDGKPAAFAIDYGLVARVYEPAISRVVGKLCADGGFDLGTVDRFYFHQANGVLPLSVARSIGIPEAKVTMDAAEKGNTSVACVGTMLAQDLHEQKIGRGSRVVLAAVGAGVSCSAALLEF